MFVVLRMIEPQKKLIKRIKQKKELKKAEAVIHPTEKGLPFFVLDVLYGKHEANWETIAQKCGRYASRIIAPRSFALPDHSHLRRFLPLSMQSVLIFNTAAETIKKAAVPPEEICITVTDRNAAQASKICDLLPLASNVRVITSRPERYAYACACAFEEYGASLIIRSSYEPTVKTDIVICCDGILSPAMESAIIFTFKQKACGKIRFFGSGTELSEHHKKIIPDNIDPVDFAGALTELCGSPEYKTAIFSDISINCSGCPDSTPEKCLRCSVKNVQKQKL